MVYKSYSYILSPCFSAYELFIKPIYQLTICSELAHTYMSYSLLTDLRVVCNRLATADLPPPPSTTTPTLHPSTTPPFSPTTTAHTKEKKRKKKKKKHKPEGLGSGREGAELVTQGPLKMKINLKTHNS